MLQKLRYFVVLGVSVYCFQAAEAQSPPCKSVVECANIMVGVATDLKNQNASLILRVQSLETRIKVLEEDIKAQKDYTSSITGRLDAIARQNLKLNVSDPREATPRVPLFRGQAEGVWTCPKDHPLMVGFGHGEGVNDLWGICAKNSIMPAE